jgi:hypothetical protein
MKELIKNEEEEVLNMLELNKWFVKTINFIDATMITLIKELTKVSHRTRRVKNVLTM